MWLVNADGSGGSRLAAGVCDDPSSLEWSPDGSRLACTHRATLVALDADGAVIAEVDGALDVRWAPDSGRLGYRTLSDEVHVLDLDTQEDEIVAEDAWLLEWPLLGRMLVALEVVVGDAAISYEANWLDLQTGETERVPRFDDGASFWLAPGGAWALVTTVSRDGLGLAIYDLETGEEQIIERGTIGFPSEYIPEDQVAISGDGASIYWADASNVPAGVFYASRDERQARRLGAVPSLFVDVSTAEFAAYAGEGANPPDIPVVVADLRAGTSLEVGRGTTVMAWRPTP